MVSAARSRSRNRKVRSPPRGFRTGSGIHRTLEIGSPIEQIGPVGHGYPPLAESAHVSFVGPAADSRPQFRKVVALGKWRSRPLSGGWGQSGPPAFLGEVEEGVSDVSPLAPTFLS